MNSYNRQWREKIRADLINYKGGKCENCGIEFNGSNSSIFDFHHVDPDEKTIDIHNNYCFERRKTEADKCVMLCSNCHRLVHSGALTVGGA
jgi:predicted HNH restriction endonuclease